MTHTLTQIARRLRRDMTDAERRLWSRLRAHQLGVHFRRQVPLERYVLDFVCFQARLVIEVDGGQHAQSEADKLRDAWLKEKGFRVLRFWNNDVLGNTEGVLVTIMQALGETPPPQPSPVKGEGENRKPFPVPGEGESRKPFPAMGEGENGKPCPAQGEGEDRKPSPAKGEGVDWKPSPFTGEGWGGGAAHEL